MVSLRRLTLYGLALCGLATLAVLAGIGALARYERRLR